MLLLSSFFNVSSVTDRFYRCLFVQCGWSFNLPTIFNHRDRSFFLPTFLHRLFLSSVTNLGSYLPCSCVYLSNVIYVLQAYFFPNIYLFSAIKQFVPTLRTHVYPNLTYWLFLLPTLYHRLFVHCDCFTHLPFSNGCTSNVTVLSSWYFSLTYLFSVVDLQSYNLISYLPFTNFILYKTDLSSCQLSLLFSHQIWWILFTYYHFNFVCFLSLLC